VTGVYETPARMVRTGQVIKVAADGHRNSLVVDIVHHEVHVGDDGARGLVVWFTGWEDGGVRVEHGWGQRPETLVLVVEDRRGHCFGALTGDLPEETA
jgi:hypothetical protein